MSSYFRNSTICEDADYSWNELEQKIKQEVNESDIGLPPGLRSAVGNQENSNSSHYNSQEEPVPGFVNLAWNGNYNTKASFGQGYPQGVGSQFLGQGSNSQAVQSFGNPKNLLNLASPVFKFGQENNPEGIVKHFNQQSFGDHLAQIQEDLLKEGQNESKLQVEEREQKPEQEELEEKQPEINNQKEIQNEQSSIQRQEDLPRENKNESKEEIQEQELKGEDPKITKQPDNSEAQEPVNQSEWGRRLKPKKEGKDEKNKSQQLQKSDEIDSKKSFEDKKLSGKMVTGGDFKSQPERMPENNRKIENIAGKETKEVNIKSSQTFEKDSDQNKKYASNSSARNEKKSTKKDVQNNEKTKSQDGWENSRTKTTQLKSEGSFKQNNKLKPFKTPFGLLMSQNSEDSDESKSRKSSDDDKEIEENKHIEEPASKENIVEQKSSNLKGDETPKETEQKEDQIDNSKKKKKKNKKKKDISSLADVPEDKKDEKGSDEDEKEKKNIIESQPEFVEELDDTNKEKSKKKKKKKKPVIERDDEKVDPTKVNKQMEQKEGTSKSFAVGAGKDSVNKEPFLERLLFVPPVGYYDYLVSLMNIKDLKEQKKE